MNNIKTKTENKIQIQWQEPKSFFFKLLYFNKKLISFYFIKYLKIYLIVFFIVFSFHLIIFIMFEINIINIIESSLIISALILFFSFFSRVVTRWFGTTEIILDDFTIQIRREKENIIKYKYNTIKYCKIIEKNKLSNYNSLLLITDDNHCEKILISEHISIKKLSDYLVKKSLLCNKN
jgi:hypothetical protein